MLSDAFFAAETSETPTLNATFFTCFLQRRRRGIHHSNLGVEPPFSNWSATRRNQSDASSRLDIRVATIVPAPTRTSHTVFSGNVCAASQASNTSELQKRMSASWSIIFSSFIPHLPFRYDLRPTDGARLVSYPTRMSRLGPSRFNKHVRYGNTRRVIGRLVQTRDFRH